MDIRLARPGRPGSHWCAPPNGTETLEKRERKPDELLAELVSAMEASGYDTEAVIAVMGG